MVDLLMEGLNALGSQVPIFITHKDQHKNSGGSMFHLSPCLSSLEKHRLIVDRTLTASLAGTA